MEADTLRDASLSLSPAVGSGAVGVSVGEGVEGESSSRGSNLCWSSREEERAVGSSSSSSSPVILDRSRPTARLFSSGENLL